MEDDGDAELDEWMAGEQRKLATMDEDGWFNYIDTIIWEEGGWVLLWMLDQPQCTQPVAARIFWCTDPFYGTESELQGKAHFNPNTSVSDLVIFKVLERWRAGAFARGKLSFPGAGQHYRNLLASYAPAADPLDVPQDLLDGFPDGVEPRPRPPVSHEPSPARPAYGAAAVCFGFSFTVLALLAWLKGWFG